jgi:arylsulfatase A-like enzyme
VQVKRVALLALLGAVIAASFALAGEPSSPAPLAASPDRPNVLIVVSDDQRSGTLDAMPKTRRLFSRRGTRYSNAYVTTPLCCPSRASILSGRYAHNHGVVRNDTDDALDYSRTIPAVLRRLGYRTGLVGKLSNAWGPREVPPYFDEVRPRWQDRALAEDDLGEMAASFIASRERSDAEPWFMWVGARAPHLPLLPDPEYRSAAVPAPISAGQVEADLSDKPAYLRAAVLDEERTSSGGFDFRSFSDQIDYEMGTRRELLSLDDMVAEVYKALRVANETNDTLAIYVSDNGYMAGEHGGLARKHLPYMEAIHVPLLVRWPDGSGGEAVSRDLVANIDIAPTVYDAVGVEPPYVLDGRSLLGGRERSYLLIERLVGGHWARFAGLVTRRLHYFENLFQDGRSRTRELYNLDQDPYELDNLTKTRPRAAEDEVAQLHALLKSARRCSGSRCP